MISRRRFCVLAVVTTAVACARIEGPIDPVWGKEPCAHCKMLVSEKRYAGQAAWSSERYFFDDIGCLALWADKHPGFEGWVFDAHVNRWQAARTAKYTSGAKTPMDFGFEANEANGSASWSELVTSVQQRKSAVR